MDIITVFNQMLVLLILLIVGVIAAKTGVMDEDTTKRFTRFSLLIPQTCMILNSVLNAELDNITPGRVFAVLGIGFLMYAILVALSFLVPVVYRCKPGDKGIYSFMTIFGNTGFMGIPVVGAIFGGAASFYAALLNIPFNLLAYTLGIALLNNTGERAKIQWKLLINPPMIASFLAIVLVCVHIPIPTPLARSIGYLGDMIIPCSMIIIGASLGQQKLKEVFGDWHVYAFAPVRLFVVPVLLWAIMHLFIKDAVLLGTITVLGAMPVASFATMLSIQYGGNVQMASRSVFVTTVLSVLTIPIVCAILPL